MVKLRGNLTDKMEANPGKVHFRRWKAMSIGSRISLVVLILIVMIAVFANILAPHNPLEIFTARQAPDAQFLFGTDDKGRDVLSRMMYGARYSLIIGLGATAFALVCGSIIAPSPPWRANGCPRSSCASWTSSCPSPVSRWPPRSCSCSATRCPRSSSRSAFCTSRRSPASCAPTW